MKRISIGIVVLILLLTVFSGETADAQVSEISIDVQINESLLTSKQVDLQSIVVQDGDSFELYRLLMSNDNPQERIEDLYLSVEFHSEKTGLIFARDQISIQSFSLDPGQRVFVTSNTIQDGFPGIDEEIYFEGTFTPEGRRFYNKLKGLSRLPHDNYSLRFSIYQGGNRLNGGTLLATSAAEFGIDIVDLQNFYLIYPGDVPGYETEISNLYPNFVWQGENTLTYRLVVVEAREGESPESLLGGAISSPPVLEDGSVAGGQLLEYEMLDVVTGQTNFQYPGSGVQNLEPGKTYYWQIVSQPNSRDRGSDIRSEIWSFTLSDQAGAGADAQLSGKLAEVLKRIIGEERYNRLEQEGSGFQSIEIGGERLQGAEALQTLLRLGDRIERMEVSIVIEE